MARFRREGRALARLHHPHIVQVFDLGRDADQYYLEMEYVDGPNLAQYLKTHGRPPLLDALEIARQVASALTYAHGQPYVDASGNRQVGMVHRDIKPSNILLREAPPLYALLADFGLVKLGDTLEHTTIGTMLGTYKYSAPEQLGLKRGRERVPVDFRADVFAFGLVLYELLEGRQFHAGLRAAGGPRPRPLRARPARARVHGAGAAGRARSRRTHDPALAGGAPGEHGRGAARLGRDPRRGRGGARRRHDGRRRAIRGARSASAAARRAITGRPAASLTAATHARRAGRLRERAPRCGRASRLLAAVAVVAAAGAWLLRGGRSGEQPVAAPAPRVVAEPPPTVGAPSSLPAPAPAPTPSPATSRRPHSLRRRP